MSLRLELVGISKHYPRVKANEQVSLKVAPGEIHAVLGENGAGKSTLMKIIYGSVQPDAGEMRWNGQRVQLASPNDARKLGIAMVFQHFSLFETLTVAENVWLGVNESSLAKVSERLQTLAATYGLEIEPARPVHSLSVGERQRVEILRALLTEPKLLILDEPTSVLTPSAIAQLFSTLRKLAAGGCSILYVSHKLDEIRALCQRCTVLRAGRVTAEVTPANETNQSLSRLMIGDEPLKLEHRELRPGEVALEITALDLPKSDDFGVTLSNVNLCVSAGEIVGVAGIAGNGQKELLAALSGEDPRGAPTAIRLFGKAITGATAARRRELGLHFVPEERLGRATVPSLSLAQNTLLTRTETLGARGLLRPSALKQLATRLIERFRVKAPGPEAAARSLSGGNLQKFVMGREIDAGPKVLLVAQPTWGVDVGAAAQIRGELLRLRAAGCALLIVSEDLDELFELSDFLVVIAKGQLSPRVRTRDVSAVQIGEWMSGLLPTNIESESIFNQAGQLAAARASG